MYKLISFFLFLREGKKKKGVKERKKEEEKEGERTEMLLYSKKKRVLIMANVSFKPMSRCDVVLTRMYILCI